MTATFRNAVTGQENELSVKGDMFGMGSVISLNGTQPVGQISRQYFNAREYFGDKQTVSCTLALIGWELTAVLCHRRTWCGPRAYGGYLYRLR